MLVTEEPNYNLVCLTQQSAIQDSIFPTLLRISYIKFGWALFNERGDGGVLGCW